MMNSLICEYCFSDLRWLPTLITRLHFLLLEFCIANRIGSGMQGPIRRVLAGLESEPALQGSALCHFEENKFLEKVLLWGYKGPFVENLYSRLKLVSSCTFRYQNFLENPHFYPFSRAFFTELLIIVCTM